MNAIDRLRVTLGIGGYRNEDRLEEALLDLAKLAWINYKEKATVMPVHVKKVGSKFRVVDPSGKIAKNAAGTALDGGGHSKQSEAIAQVHAVNISLHKEGKI